MDLETCSIYRARCIAADDFTIKVYADHVAGLK
jgi:hypothetical protein